MLTLKQITENTEDIIRGLEKKHFKDAGVKVAPYILVKDKDSLLKFAEKYGFPKKPTQVYLLLRN